MPKRYFEFRDASSEKFWEIEVVTSRVTVRFGKIGTDGQTKTKEFATASEARSHAETVTAEKVRSGYKPAPRGRTSSPAARKKAPAGAKGSAKSIASPQRISWFVTINFVSENPAEECEWFGPDASDPFPSGLMVDVFLDDKDGIVGVRSDDGDIALGREAAAERCRTIFEGELAPLAPGGKLRSTLSSSALIDGMKVNWDGDAKDLAEDERDGFLKACSRKGAIVVWKQIRGVNWKPKDAVALEALLDRGDHDSYEDFIAVV